MSQDSPPPTASPTLQKLRDELDQLDADLVTTIRRRFDTVARIIEEKRGHTGGIRDPKREQDVLTRAEALAESVGLSAPLIRKIFSEIIAHSVNRQASTLTALPGTGPALRIAYQGSPYTFNFLAAQKFASGLGRREELLGKTSLRQTVSALESQDADLAFLLLENTAGGSISKIYDFLLAHDDIHIVGEEIYKVDMCLAGVDGASLSSTEKVLSHPLALEQCSHFLDSLPNARPIASFDTAEALWTVAQGKDLRTAAIGSPEGIEAFGLTVLQRNIGNQAEIFNRYVALARKPIAFDPRIPCKTSLVLATRDEAGALEKCLEILARHGLSLTKLESRPRADKPFEYLFFVDFRGNTADAKVQSALEILQPRTTLFKILGSYPERAHTADAALARPTRP